MLIRFLKYLKEIKMLHSKIQKIFSPKNLRNQMLIKFYPVENSNLIKKGDKILIIAPHPDDEVIGCGGIIAKYKNQIDVLCINSSGVKYEWNSESAEEIAQIRCDEFYETMKHAGINKCRIAKIWGVPPMFDSINSHLDDYINNFDYKNYDYIFVPHQFDGHREHRFVGNHLVKKILKRTGYKKDLKIARYEVWSTIKDPNYFEDITDVKQEKEFLINLYKSRSGAKYAEKILALNYYRAMTPFFSNPEKFAEAFYIQSIQEYLNEKDDRSWNKEC